MDMFLIAALANAGSALEAAREHCGPGSVQASMISKVEDLIEQMVDIEVRGMWLESFPKSEI